VTDAREIVQRGYDTIAERFDEWADSFETPERQWIAELMERLEPNANVLDLGCGGGRRSARAVARRHRYTGVDVSEAQLGLARTRIPNATFVHADATRVEFDAAAFDAVVSLFMFGHIPRAEQGPLLDRIFAWLRPGGWFLATFATGDSEDMVEDDWLGAPMFFASFDEQTNRRNVARAGFEVEEARVVPFEEPGHGLVRFWWVLARKPPGRAGGLRFRSRVGSAVPRVRAAPPRPPTRE
jgi:cyclopropane fatty-acyl-phospholipid synthase-like methyltransferase